MLHSEGPARTKAQTGENRVYGYKCVILYVLGLEVSD